MSTSEPSPELLRLKRQAVKRFHPDNAVDKQDEIRLTCLMQEANAAFDARDEERLRAVFAPPQPPPPQAPPNAWKPRTYQASQTPAQPQQHTQRTPSAQSAQTSPSYKVWFWVIWGTWSVISLAAGNGWLIWVGLFAALFLAHYVTKFQHSVGNWFRARQAGATQTGFKLWFWATWVAFGCVGFSLGSIGKAGTPLGNTAAATCLLYIAIGGIIAFVMAVFHNHVQPWLAAQKASGKLPFLVGIIVVLIFFSTIPMVVAGGNRAQTAPVAAPSGKVAPDHIVSGSVENNYLQGVVQTVGKKFSFASDRGHSNPPDGTAVEMTFQIGPTGYHNAATVAKSSGDGGLDWACYQAVDKSPSFGDLPASAKGGSLLVFYNCVFNRPDSITKVVLIPAGSVPAPPKPPVDLSAGLVPKVKFETPKPKSFDEQYGWYVQGIKDKVAQNWYLSEVMDSTPAGATVYVGFQVGRTGYLVGDVTVKNVSGYYSLDASCVHAVKRTWSFGPLPDGYHEKVLNVLYHCTYPGKSVTTYTATSGHVISPVEVAHPVETVISFSVKVQGTIQRSFERWPTWSAPAGTVVVGRTVINDDGTPGTGIVVTSSGWEAVDRACVTAASNVTNFGRPPAGSMVVQYTCTVKGH